jgi:hypothetical protein
MGSVGPPWRPTEEEKKGVYHTVHFGRKKPYLQKTLHTLSKEKHLSKIYFEKN